MPSCCGSSASPDREGGFTLLELLVVFFIVALLSGLAVVSLRGTDPEGTLREETRKIKELMDLASQEAVSSFRDIGLRFSTSGYVFWIRHDGNPWEVLKGDALLRQRDLPEGMTLSLWLEEVPVDLPDALGAEKGVLAGEAPMPQLFFFSSGERLPFRLRLQNKSGLYRDLSGSLLGDLKIEGPAK
ncbi:MAG: type II secretion system minor pseudopilin GspH [Magnetococcales bacterium]|nr:type II secretion system minor pseudopilin GspH [Magnetococcales bacterium]